MLILKGLPDVRFRAKKSAARPGLLCGKPAAKSAPRFHTDVAAAGLSSTVSRVVVSRDAPAPALPLELKNLIALEHARVTSMRRGDAGGVERISLDDLGALFSRIRDSAF